MLFLLPERKIGNAATLTRTPGHGATARERTEHCLLAGGPGSSPGELEAVKTVEEIREDIIRKASENEAFRAELLADPKDAIEKELGVTIPEGFKIGVHEDNIMSINLVLPPAELSEADLSAVVAGSQSWQDFANAWNSLNQNS